MSIYILLFLIILIVLVAYVTSHNDIMAPSVLLSCGYLIACVSCIMNIEKWGVDLHFNTCFILVLGIMFFGVGELISRAFFHDFNIHSNEMRFSVYRPEELKCRYHLCLSFRPLTL